MKRKKFIKCLMAHGIPRNKAVLYADMCSGEMPHRRMAPVIILQPEISDMMWQLWVRVRARGLGCQPKARLVRHGQT